MKYTIAAAALATTLSISANAAPGAKTPEQIIEHHIAAANAGDLDALMADYADDAVSLMPGETISGKASIKEGFSHIVGPGAKDKVVVTPTKISSAGNVGMFHYTTNVGVSGNESFVIRNGKIIVDAVFFDAPPKQ